MADILKYTELTTFELDNLNREKTVFILPVSPLEEHGPHLPLGTDLYLAESLAAGLAVELSKKTWFDTIILFPGLPVGVGGILMPGTIESNAQMVESLVVDFGSNLSRSGFKYGLLASGHGGQEHVDALNNASSILKKQNNFEMIPISNYIIEQFFSGQLIPKINQRLSKPLTEEQLAIFSTDSHAGWWETSAMLFLHPEHVRDNFKSLPAKSEIDAGGYQGAPAFADEQFARAVIETMYEEALAILKSELTLK